MCIGLQFILLLFTGNRWLQKLKAQFRQTTIAFICIYCLFILLPCEWYASFPVPVLLFALKYAIEGKKTARSRTLQKYLSKKRMSKVKITGMREAKRKGKNNE